MKRRYLFQSKWFWLIWVTLFVAFYLYTHVQIHFDIVFDTVSGKMEPVWHLILRNFGIINGGEYATYDSSLTPILHQLPYVFAFFILCSICLITVTFIIQRLLFMQKNLTSGCTTDAAQAPRQ